MVLIGNQVKAIVIFFIANRILFNTIIVKINILKAESTTKSTPKPKKTHQKFGFSAKKNANY